MTGKIYIAGHRGMVGSALLRRFPDAIVRTSKQLDLRDQRAVFDFFANEKPDYVFLAAAKVGGIHANNTYRGEFLYDNLMIQNNVIHSAYLTGVKKLLFLGSSCVYPKYADQPIKEESLLTGALEPTNEPYALAKIAGVKMCEYYREQYGCNFISAMPCNLYGQNDNYHGENSHVIPALIKKFSEGDFNVWGDGSALREFMHVDDLTDALILLMEKYEGGLINVGSGEEVSIKTLALFIRDIMQYENELIFDTSKPNGTPRKIMDNTKIRELGFKPKIHLIEGLKQVIANYKG
jgi:GDP-L-fucose synthase